MSFNNEFGDGYYRTWKYSFLWIFILFISIGIYGGNYDSELFLLVKNSAVLAIVFGLLFPVWFNFFALVIILLSYFFQGLVILIERITSD